MAVDDHGLETIRKSGEEVVPGSKADYYIKVGGLPPGSPGVIVPIPVEFAGAKTPLITPVTTVAITETSHTFAVGLKQFILRTRDKSVLKWAWIATGTTGPTFFTLEKNGVLSRENLNTTAALTIYFQTNVADIVEIEEWS